MELTIIVAIIAFLAVTLLLVGLLLFAKAKLTSSGEVTIDINGGEKVITTESGSTLLATLANNKVFLPSACGGGGSCGMCKCQVIEGGGDILPTETGFITRKMAKEHWRLGCQVKVKENLKIQVPEAVLGVKKWECTVVSNRNISTFLKEFVVKLPEGENLKFRSGGYIQIDIPKYDAIKFSDMTSTRPTVPTGTSSRCGIWLRPTPRLRSVPTRWPTTRPRVISSCSTSVSPRRRSTRLRAGS